MTVIARAATKLVARRMEDMEWMALYAAYAQSVRNGDYYQGYLDVLGQRWGGAPERPLESLNAFIGLHYLIRTGQVALSSIHVGHHPCADKEVELMNERLADLPGPFKAQFWGGLEDQDGELIWTRPIHAVRDRYQPIPDREPGRYWVIVQPGSVGLEVGYCSPEKILTLINPLGAGRGLARWPYGQDRITLLVNRGFSCEDDAEFEGLRENAADAICDDRDPYYHWKRNHGLKKQEAKSL